MLRLNLYPVWAVVRPNFQQLWPPWLITFSHLFCFTSYLLECETKYVLTIKDSYVSKYLLLAWWWSHAPTIFSLFDFTKLLLLSHKGCTKMHDLRPRISMIWWFKWNLDYILLPHMRKATTSKSWHWIESNGLNSVDLVMSCNLYHMMSQPILKNSVFLKYKIVTTSSF